MSDVQEVFDVMTKHIQRDPGAWRDQERRQRRARRNRKIGAMAVVAVLAAAAVAAAVALDDSGRDERPRGATGPAAPLGLAVVGLDGAVEDLDLPSDAWMADLTADGTSVAFLTSSIHVGFCGACGASGDRPAIVPLGRDTGAYVYTSPGFAAIEHLAFSPDGTKLAFVGRRGGNSDIYVADLRGATGEAAIMEVRAVRLTTDPGIDEFPAWAPDGSTIVYDNEGIQQLDSSGLSPTQELWSVPADGSALPTRLTRNDEPDTQADIASDGTVAFWRGGSIWTMRLDGSEQQRLTEVPEELGFNPRWSPDGTKMAVLRYDPSERTTAGRMVSLPLLEVVVVDLSTGELTGTGMRVASDVNPVSWFPDGERLLIDRYDEGG
jgi:Tol biopolymer transport system component